MVQRSNTSFFQPAPAFYRRANLGLAVLESTLSGGSLDNLDGDQLAIDFTPVNYTPSTAPPEATTLDHLAAHLSGVDTALGGLGLGSHAASHIQGGSDEVDGDQLDIDFTPSNYVPDVTPAEATDVDHLAAHLAGIDNALASLGSVDVVANIAARDALTPSTGDRAYVTDASADAAVDAGAAFYLWDGAAWVKVSEAESFDNAAITISPAAADQVGVLGTSLLFARQDHQHPAQSAAVTLIADAGALITATDVEGALQEGAGEWTTLRTLSGTAAGDSALGTFTGVTIADGSTITGALQALETAVEALTGGQVVADIAARDALTAAAGDIAHVTDASGDAAVNSGAATYIYDGAAWQKIAEAESEAKVRIFADDATVNPGSNGGTAGNPSEAEILTFAGANRDTILYYTGTDTATDAATFVYHIDAAGALTTLLAPGSATPGIDDVLAVSQALTAPRTIETGANPLIVQSGTPTNQMVYNESLSVAGGSVLGHVDRQVGLFIAEAFIDFTTAEPALVANELYVNTVSGTGSGIAGAVVAGRIYQTTNAATGFLESAPAEGWKVFSRADNTTYYYDGAAWIAEGSSVGFDDVLAAGQALTAARVADLAGNDLTFLRDTNTSFDFSTGLTVSGGPALALTDRQIGLILVESDVDFTTAEPALAGGNVYRNTVTGTSNGTSLAVTADLLYQANPTNTGWIELTPQEGWKIFDRGLDTTFHYSGGAWVAELASPMSGATSAAAGAAGTVPQPVAGDQNAALLGSATWEKLDNRTRTSFPALSDGSTGAWDSSVAPHAEWTFGPAVSTFNLNKTIGNSDGNGSVFSMVLNTDNVGGTVVSLNANFIRLDGSTINSLNVVNGTAHWYEFRVQNDLFVLQDTTDPALAPQATTTIPDWAGSTAYDTHEIVKQGHLYLRRVAAGTSEATYTVTEATNWTVVSQDEVLDWAPSTVYTQGEQVTYNGQLYRCTGTSFTSAATFAIGNLVLEHQSNDLQEWAADTRHEVDSLIRRDDLILRKAFGANPSGSTFDTTEANQWAVVGGLEPFGELFGFLEDPASGTGTLTRSPADRARDITHAYYTLEDSDAAVASNWEAALTGFSFANGDTYAFQFDLSESAQANHIFRVEYADGGGNSAVEFFNIGSAAPGSVAGGADAGNVTAVGVFETVDRLENVYRVSVVLTWTGASGGSPVLRITPVYNADGTTVEDATQTGISAIVNNFRMGAVSDVVQSTAAVQAVLQDSSGGNTAATLPSATGSGDVILYTNDDVQSNSASVGVQAGESINGVTDGSFLFSNYADGTQFQAVDKAVGEWVVSVVGDPTQQTLGFYSTRGLLADYDLPGGVYTLPLSGLIQADTFEGVDWSVFEDNTQGWRTGEVLTVPAGMGGRYTVTFEVNHTDGNFGGGASTQTTASMAAGGLRINGVDRWYLVDDAASTPDNLFSTFDVTLAEGDTIQPVIESSAEVNEDIFINLMLAQRPSTSAVLAGMVTPTSLAYVRYSLSADSAATTVCPFDEGVGDTSVITNAAGTITLPAGKYRIQAHATRHGASVTYELYDVTNATQLESYRVSEGDIGASGVTLPYYLTVTAPTDIQIRETNNDVSVIWNGRDSGDMEPFGCYIDIQQLPLATVVAADALTPETLSRLQVRLSATTNDSGAANYGFDTVVTQIDGDNPLVLEASGTISGLKAGKTYRLHSSMQALPPAQGSAEFRFLDVTNNTQIGATWEVVTATYTTNASGQEGYALFVPPTDCEVAVDFTGGTVGEMSNRSTFTVEEVAPQSVIAYSPGQLEATTLQSAVVDIPDTGVVTTAGAAYEDFPSPIQLSLPSAGRYELTYSVSFTPSGAGAGHNLRFANGVGSEVPNSAMFINSGTTGNSKLVTRSVEYTANGPETISLQFESTAGIRILGSDVLLDSNSWVSYRQLPTTEVVTPGDVPVTALSRARLALGANQLLTAGVPTQISFNQEVYDIGGIASGSQVTIATTGYYRLAAFWTNITVVANDTLCEILVDGTAVATSGENQASGGGTGRRMPTHVTLQLTAGQVVTVRATCGDQNTTVAGNATEDGSRAYLEVHQLPTSTVVTGDVPVDITGISDGDSLIWNAANSQLEPGTANGSLTDALLVAAGNNVNLTSGNHDRVDGTSGLVASDTVTVPAAPSVGSYGEFFNASGVDLVLAIDGGDAFLGSPSTAIPANSGFTWRAVAANVIEVIGTGDEVSQDVAADTGDVTKVPSVAAAEAAFGGVPLASQIIEFGTGTYTPTPGTRRALIYLVGGGGAGGGAISSASQSGGSGGSAGVVHMINAPIDDATTYTCLVGAAGASVSGGNGGNGGVTQITIEGFTYDADAGIGGTTSDATAADSIQLGATHSLAEGADTGIYTIYTIPGQAGGAYFDAGVANNCITGAGGSCMFGAGGRQLGSASATSANGDAGEGYGAGGGGAHQNNGTARSGGNGAPGVIIIHEYK